MGTRLLESKEDIDFAVELTVKEGWNYTHREIELMLDLDPEGNFVYEDDNELLGFVTTVTYSRTGVIGHLIVSGKARGKRIGDSLMRSAIQYLEGRRVESMMVYATVEGARLYAKHGFTPRDEIFCAHSRLAKGHIGRRSDTCTPVTAIDLDEIISIDRQLFGDDRSRLLKTIHRHSTGSSFKIDRGKGIEGYIFVRPDHVGHDLGPWACVSGRPEDAEDLFLAALSTVGEGILYSGSFIRNKVAGRIIRKLPLERHWNIPMMIRGKGRYESDVSKAFALAAFELG